MSDIKKFLLRMPTLIADGLAKEAAEKGLSLNEFIVQRLSANYIDTQVTQSVTEWADGSVTRDIKPHLPIASAEVLAERINAFRLKHALDCKCLMCKPPKPQ